MYLQKAISLKEKIINELVEFDKQILSKFQINKYIYLLSKQPKVRKYSYIAPEIEDLCAQFIKESNQEILEIYHQLLLVELICLATEKLEILKYQIDIKKLYETNFNRILTQIETKNESGFYLLSQDKFRKDLGVCCLFLIPAGAQKVHLDSLQSFFLYKNGFRQFAKGIGLIVKELKGLSPLFQMHTDSHDPDLMADFNAEGWKKFYIRTADLLRQNKHVKGVFGSSWFFDPKLEKISPRLAYLRKIVEEGGGKVFHIGSSPNAIKNSTQKSETRRQLYNKGAYLPTNYLVVWPRDSLIKWAKRE